LIVASKLGNTVEQIGAYGGLASMIGLGVLALLYFAQAREVKRLREWAGRAPERAAEVEQRVQADAQRRVIAQPQTPAGQVAATPAGAAPPAQLPTAGLIGEAATHAAAAAIVAARASHVPPNPVGPPGQLARPNLPPNLPPIVSPGSPTPAAQAGAALPPAPGAVPKPNLPPAPSTTPGLGGPGAPSPASPQPAKPAAPAPAKPAAPAPASATPTPAAPLSTHNPTATASSPPAAPAKPRVVAQPPPSANGGGQETRESAAARPLPSPPSPAARSATPPPPDDDEGISPGRILAIIGGVLGLVLVVGLIVMVLSGGDPAPSTPSTLGTVPAAEPEQNDPSTTTGSDPVRRADTEATVLNGTTQAGLASTVAAKLEKAGFKKGDVADNVDQTLAETVVYYSEGNEREAKDVAKVIGVNSSAVQPADRNVELSGSGAPVVVTVGADLIE